MNYRDEIIWNLAEAACKRVSRRVIRSLTKMTDGMWSGDDTPLKNVWDEICVQVQGEESVMWDSHVDYIQSLMLNVLRGIDAATKRAIWLQTDEGIDWSVDSEDQKGDQEQVPFADEDVAEYIVNEFVLSAAADWSNKRIEKYLERGID